MDYVTWLSGTKKQDSYKFIHDGPIVRGTTQEHSFELPSVIVEPTEIIVAYKQKNKLILTKKIDLNTDSLIYSIILSETETLRFKPNVETKVQLKIETEDSLFVSDVFNIIVEDSVYNMQVTECDETYALEAYVDRFRIKVKNFFTKASDTDFKCKFFLDGDWKNFESKAYFKDSYNHLYAVLIKNDECIIPAQILEKPGVIHVGLYSKTKRATIWSNSIRLQSAVSFVANDETREPTIPEDELMTFYYGSFESVPSTLTDFIELTQLEVNELVKNGITIEAGGDKGLLFFACSSKYKVSRIIMEDTWELTPPEDQDADSDYEAIESNEFNMYYISKKTFESAKYTIYIKEVSDGN